MIMACRRYPKEFYTLKNFLHVNRRCFSRHVVWSPKLKEMLEPPKPPEKLKQLPRIEDIKIPNKIKRSPTDLLKALASTVGRDYTAPHYKFHDDPYLIPYSNMSKRNYALSKEAGKKAAKWVREQHADLFQHSVAEPAIEAFFPRPVFTEESAVTEDDLKHYIQQGMMTESVKVYGLLKSKGNLVSDETKQAVLELLCYFNEVEPIDEDLVEERWFSFSGFSRDRLKNTWKSDGLAEAIFKEMENPPIEAYCSMIQGYCKFYHTEKAWYTYTEARSKNLVPDVETFNSLLRISNFLRENAELRLDLLQELLVEMKELQLTPNLGTLNAILESLSVIGNPKQAKALALATLSEFKILGIEPSLSSYYFLLMLFCREKGPVSTILADILKEIRGKQFTIQDVKDINFFVTAMDVARHHLQNVELAYQIDDLLHTGNNYDLIGDSFKESIYYRHYLALRCLSEPFEDFMNYYFKIVPNVYTPEPGIMEEILKALEINRAISYLPRLWSDIIIFDQSTREHLLSLVLHIMASNFPAGAEESELSQSEKLGEQFSEIGWKIWTIIEFQDRERARVTNWSGKMLADLLTVQVKGSRFENACEIIKKLLSPSAAAEVVGVPTIESLKLFLDAAVVQNNGAMCLACLHYMNDCGFPEVRDFGQQVFDKVALDSLQSSKLSQITGIEVVAVDEEGKNK